MHLSRLASLAALAVSAYARTQYTVQASSADAYVASESTVAKAGVLANIGPHGAKASGAKAGVVIASPSTVDPDYLYTWTRDSSLVFKTLIDQFTTGEDTSLRGLIDDFTAAEAVIQQTSNPSGTVTTGGLGEPKFHIDGSEFTDPWGRPQRDGPALRATAIITYANWLLANGNGTSYVKDTLWPIVKLDLDYVQENWNQSTFDLWEEVNSSSFFTTAVQHRALREGATFAKAVGHSSVADSYTTQAENLLCFLQSYWNAGAGYVTSNTGGGRSGKDSNSVLASIHTFDVEAGCDPTTFQPCSDKALSNLKVYIDSFRSVYGINHGLAFGAAVAVGRYPEDIYYEGNPWYLSVFAVAEQLYDALITWDKQGSLEITPTSLSFFRQFYSSLTAGVFPSSSSGYHDITSAIRKFADGFLEVNAKYTPVDGALSEQFDKSTGKPLSAADLTWSYASALTAFAARSGKTYASWGAAGLTLPSQCNGNAGKTVSVTFNVNAKTVPGENIYITGSVAALQSWSPDTALPLSSAKYPTWSITVKLPASTVVEYKYIRKQDGRVTWESDPNNSITTPEGGVVTQDDVWR